VEGKKGKSAQRIMMPSPNSSGASLKRILTGQIWENVPQKEK